MIGEPQSWLTAVAVIGALIGGAFLGDALGREIRKMLADDSTGDWPAALQGDLPAIPQDDEAFHARKDEA